MTSRERVRRCLVFDSPDRIPRQLWLLHWANLHHAESVAAIQQRFPDDLVSSPPCLSRPCHSQGAPQVRGLYTDEWGCVFENVQDGVIGEVKHPLLGKWDELDTIRIPEERLTLDRKQVDAFCASTDRYVLSGTCPRPFERLQFLRGTANLMVDLIDQPPELRILLDRMHAFYVKELELWARTGVDALSFMDDWGSQRALLISPDLWRELFKPLYRDYIEIAHRRGKAAFMHSDGYILDILPDLIELGLDAINCQVFCMGVERLGESCAGRITFWGELDRQHILPFGTPDDVRQAVELMYQALYREGGVIAQCEFGAGARPENVMAYFEAWASL